MRIDMIDIENFEDELAEARKSRNTETEALPTEGGKLRAELLLSPPHFSVNPATFLQAFSLGA